MANNEKRQRKGRRQEWKPLLVTRIVYRVWQILLSVLKVAAGALATVLLIGIVCCFVVVNLLGDYLQEEIMPLAEMNLEDYNLEKTSYVYCYDEKGNVQILQQIHSSTDRQWTKFEDLPKELLYAAVAIEDKRFYEHQGVDWITTSKACINMFFGGSSQFGGSTITQQLVKNLELMVDPSADDVTVQRKILEIFRAQAFEKTYDKDVVMEWYMNTVYFGEGCYGVKSAAENYFGKELKDMTAAELASLIGITNNPSLFNPYRTWRDGKDMNGAERNRDRQLTILGEMVTQGWITKEQYDVEKNQLLVYKRGIADEDRWSECVDVVDADGFVLSRGCGYEGPVRDLIAKTEGDKTTHYCPQCGNSVNTTTDASQIVYSWYVDTVLEDVARALAEKDGVTQWTQGVRERYINKISRSGYHIYTPYSPAVQEAVDKVYTNLDEIPSTLGTQQLQSAIVVIDNTTGDIVAMSGGVGDKLVADAFNRAVDAQRQPGSSIKPITVYAQAFEKGIITPATIVDDLPLYYTNGSPYPLNDSRTYAMHRTVWTGIINSINAISVRTLDKLGVENSFYFARDQLGISTLLEKYVNSAGVGYTDMSYSPLGMGAFTYGATVRDMTNAYSTFANKGVYREGRTYYGVLDDNGNVILDNDQQSKQLFGEKAMNYLNYCLTDAVSQGTGTAADLFTQMGISTAGKTGTTQSNKDRYFCGFTGYYTAAVWCGFDIPEPIYMNSDIAAERTNPSCQLWKKVMVQLHQGLDNIPLYDSSKMEQALICADSGLLATEACVYDIRSSRNIYQFLYPEDIPTTYCDQHVIVDYCTDGVANEYCHKFHEVGLVSFQEKALLRLTQKRIQQLMEAKGKGLLEVYLMDNYVYFVDEQDNPLPFYGMEYHAATKEQLEDEEYEIKMINEGYSAPYQVCTKHTKQAWKDYVKDHPWLDDGILDEEEPEVPAPEAPIDPTDPTDPTLPPKDETDDTED